MNEESHFVKVKCEDCENEQVIFNKASTEIKCSICGRTLVVPTGGRAEIKSQVVEEID
ncbi:MAG: Ribosomal protein S27E [Candidatus Methanohalarchaeum thermophilum]|uniref:Small ribosomal subunit protein eS27 n=1 Tax=Methanohalarchaeum thermophilum TaxID=1903181 RepID=A0A1Q6DW63_METT1|nr:MAG: Ribosomal protein S27E [Candidatus Methanohalarchaeum thermophilum]